MGNTHVTANPKRFWQCGKCKAQNAKLCKDILLTVGDRKHIKRLNLENASFKEKRNTLHVI